MNVKLMWSSTKELYATECVYGMFRVTWFASCAVSYEYCCMQCWVLQSNNENNFFSNAVIYHVTALNQVITLQLCCYFRYRSSLVVWILLWVTAPTLAAWWIFFKSNFILVSYKFISFYFNYTFRVLCNTMV